MNPEETATNNPIAQSAPQQEPIPEVAAAAPAQKTAVGPIIGAIIVILILGAGAVYFFLQQESLKQPSSGYSVQNSQPTGLSTKADAQASAAAASVDSLNTDMNQSLNQLNQSFATSTQ